MENKKAQLGYRVEKSIAENFRSYCLENYLNGNKIIEVILKEFLSNPSNYLKK